MAAVDYTADELIYAPRNPRPHRVYGFSPVEQIVMSANVALRRQVSQLNYFTEGNTPEALIGVPDDWTPDQIRQFQEYWDALLQGNLAARRHTRFVPGGLKYQPTRDAPLKDDFDEWLARIVCFAFSIPPTAFSSQVNRATAETAQQAALAEGLAPLQNWLKGLIDRILTRVLGWDDLEFAWAAGSAVDPLMQAQIDTAYVAAGIKTADEVRTTLGLGALPSRAVAKFNPNHDARGRFASGDGAGSGRSLLQPVVGPEEEDPEDPENEFENEFEEEQEKMRQRMPSILNLSGQNRNEIPGQHAFSPMGIAGGALGNSGAKEPGVIPTRPSSTVTAGGAGASQASRTRSPSAMGEEGTPHSAFGSLKDQLERAVIDEMDTQGDWTAEANFAIEINGPNKVANLDPSLGPNQRRFTITMKNDFNGKLSNWSVNRDVDTGRIGRVKLSSRQPGTKKMADGEIVFAQGTFDRGMDEIAGYYRVRHDDWRAFRFAKRAGGDRHLSIRRLGRGGEMNFVLDSEQIMNKYIVQQVLGNALNVSEWSEVPSADMTRPNRSSID